MTEMRRIRSILMAPVAGRRRQSQIPLTHAHSGPRVVDAKQHIEKDNTLCHLDVTFGWETRAARCPQRLLCALLIRPGRAW